MDKRYLYKAKRVDNSKWIEGFLFFSWETAYLMWGSINNTPDMIEVDPATLCRCTELVDKNRNIIWENDILMCHGNKKDLTRAVFGEFEVIDVATLSVVDNVIGWHYKVVPTDELSRCKPFNIPMPLTENYIKQCEMEVVGNVFDENKLLQYADQSALSSAT